MRLGVRLGPFSISGRVGGRRRRKSRKPSKWPTSKVYTVKRVQPNRNGTWMLSTGWQVLDVAPARGLDRVCPGDRIIFKGGVLTRRVVWVERASDSAERPQPQVR